MESVAILLLTRIQHQAVDPLYETSRVFQLAAFGQHSLLEQQVGPIAKHLVRVHGGHLLQQRVLQVDFQYRLAVRPGEGVFAGA